MAQRQIPLVAGEYYHIYNRGIARQPTFRSKRDYEQVILALSYYRFHNPPVKLSRLKELPQKQRDRLFSTLQKEGEKLVDIVSFVLMPNHFHFLVRQVANKGISIFMSTFTNSFTRYFNTKHKRPGPIFQGVFKAVHIETTEQLIHLSRYIHLNPLVSFVVHDNEFLSYPWSSFPDYLKGMSEILDLSPVLSNFVSVDEYKTFVLDQIGYAKRLEEMKHLLLD